MEAYLYLLLAVISEVTGTTALKSSDGLTRFWPAVLVVVSYSISFWSLSIALKTLPVGSVYAIWCGLGIVSMILIGVFLFGETFTPYHFIGTALVLAGVLILTLLNPA